MKTEVDMQTIADLQTEENAEKQQIVE